MEKSIKIAVQFNRSLQCLTPSSNLNICSLPFWNATSLSSCSFYIRTEKPRKKKRKIACNVKPVATEARHWFFRRAAPRFVFTAKPPWIITLGCCFWLKYHYTYTNPLQWKSHLNKSGQKNRIKASSWVSEIFRLLFSLLCEQWLLS